MFLSRAIMGATSSATLGTTADYDGYSFDGSGDYINAGQDASIVLTNDFTWAGWIYPTDATSETIISRYESTGNKRALVWQVSSGVLTAVGSTDGTFQAGNVHISTVSITTNVWTFVTLRLTGGTLYMSKNAGTEESFTQAALYGGTADLLIGAHGAGASELFNGTMQNIFVFNTSLSAGEISTLYNSSTPILYPLIDTDITDDCVLNYFLNSNSNPLTDNSTSGNNGTANGGVTSDGQSITWQVRQ